MKTINFKSTYHYSLNFKAKVVSEIEFGKYTVVEAKRIYNIGGNMTIYNWIKQFGKNDILNKVIRVETKKEKNRIKELNEKQKALKVALLEAQTKNIVLETLIECANSYYRTDLKKNFGNRVQKECGRKK